MSLENGGDDEVESAAKINCGIWVTLDLILAKREQNQIWDKYEPIFGRSGGLKKKDRLKCR